MKTRTGLPLILSLAFFLAVGGIMVDFVEANPVYLDLEFPDKPIMTPPTFVVDSPIRNQTYNSTGVWLNFTITKPDDWFKGPSRYFGSDDDGNPYYLFFGHITSVFFILDDGQAQNFPVQDNSNLNGAFPNRIFNFSTNLTLTEGTHSIIVGLEANSYYRIVNVSNGIIYPVGVGSRPLNVSSGIINFSVRLSVELKAGINQQDQEAFPASENVELTLETLLVLGLSASLITITVICLVYRCKRVRNKVL